MKKKNLFLPVILVFVYLAFISQGMSVFASNLSSIQSIIAGKQDKLIFATIVSVGSRVCSVEVMEEIGEDTTADKKDDAPQETDTSILGKKIDVEGLNSYMYYEGFDHNPKIGDNVLISLTFSGNVYRVKNGVFYVSAASHDTFNFIVPDTVDGTAGAMELTALYRFIGTNGKNADFTIKDSVVYTHDTAKGGVEIRIENQEGLTFVNEKGETTKETETGNAQSDFGATDSPNRWLFACAIIIVGAFAGLFITKLAIGFEKKIDSK